MLNFILLFTTFTRFGFFWPPTPCVYIFYGINVYKKSNFLTTYPPPLVNVVCERPLTFFFCYHSIDLPFDAEIAGKFLHGFTYAINLLNVVYPYCLP